jgi:Family of unknown function (DUF6387)
MSARNSPLAWFEARVGRGHYNRLRDYDARAWNWQLDQINGRLWRLARRVGEVDFPSWRENFRGFVPAYIGPPPVQMLAPGEEPEGLPSSRLACMAADLTASDAVLCEDFKAIVRQEREAQGVPSPIAQRGRVPAGMPNDRVGQPQFDIWRKNRIVELADIEFWCRAKRRPITRGQIAAVLFSNNEPKRVSEARAVLKHALRVGRQQLWAQSLSSYIPPI